MVYAFVKRSHGYIKCDSDVGTGSTFHIYLPKKTYKVITQRQYENTDDALVLGTETVLVVDDEIDLLELACDMLKASGYQVLKASDGSEALKQLSQHPEINLLFSDVVMPNGVNGYELAEQATAHRKDLKVLLTSGFTDKAEYHDTRKYFSENLLNKPYSQTELARKVRLTLDKVGRHL